MIEGTLEFNDPTNDPEPKLYPCPKCHGEGKILVASEQEDGEMGFGYETCPLCNGLCEVDADGLDFFAEHKRRIEK